VVFLGSQKQGDALEGVPPQQRFDVLQVGLVIFVGAEGQSKQDLLHIRR
jgi:hypothetical protein